MKEGGKRSWAVTSKSYSSSEESGVQVMLFFSNTTLDPKRTPFFFRSDTTAVCELLQNLLGFLLGAGFVDVLEQALQVLEGGEGNPGSEKTRMLHQQAWWSSACASLWSCGVAGAQVVIPDLLWAPSSWTGSSGLLGLPEACFCFPS